MERSRTRNETVQALLEKVIYNQEVFSKRKLDKVQDEDTQAKKKMDTRDTTGRIMSNQPEVWDDLSLDTDLPLDAVDLNQASQLLEAQDFADMLNKIPEDGLNDLLSEHKNEDFLPTEELETALSEVDKDYKQMGNTSYKDISYPDGAIHHPLQADNSSAITSPLTSSELNSASQALSSMPLEAAPYFTNLGSSQSQGPMDSRNDAHDHMQMTTSMQVGELTEKYLFPADRARNFLGNSIDMDTQVLPRYYTQQRPRGPHRSRWTFNQPKSRYHSMVGPSQSGSMMNSQGYNQQLGTTKMGVGNSTMLPNLAMKDHGYYCNQAMVEVNPEQAGSRMQHQSEDQDSKETLAGIQRQMLTTNSISCLNEICPGLNYQYVSRTGPDHCPLFTASVKMHGTTYTGTGSDKKRAKHAAAEAALKALSVSANKLT